MEGNRLETKTWFHITPKRLCMMGVLLAMQIVMARLMNVSVGAWLRINLGFLPNAVAGMLTGPFCGMLVAACGDLLGATLFPTGAYFPGYTLSAAIGGAIYGLFLYRRDVDWKRAALCILPITLVCNIGLNTLWIAMTSGAVAMVNFPARVLKNLIQYPVNVALLTVVAGMLKRLPADMTHL